MALWTLEFRPGQSDFMPSISCSRRQCNLPRDLLGHSVVFKELLRGQFKRYSNAIWTTGNDSWHLQYRMTVWRLKFCNWFLTTWLGMAWMMSATAKLAFVNASRGSFKQISTKVRHWPGWPGWSVWCLAQIKLACSLSGTDLNFNGQAFEAVWTCTKCGLHAISRGIGKGTWKRLSDMYATWVKTLIQAARVAKARNQVRFGGTSCKQAMLWRIQRNWHWYCLHDLKATWCGVHQQKSGVQHGQHAFSKFSFIFTRETPAQQVTSWK